MVRYLRRWGHSVTVVTSDSFGTLDPEEAPETLYVKDLAGTRIVSSLIGRVNSRTPDETFVSGRTTRPIPPDKNLLTWVPNALRAVKRLLSEADFDVIITNSPPESTTVIPLLLGRRSPAWLADFRDAWILDDWRPPFPTRFHDRFDRRLERTALTRADVVTVAHRRNRDDLLERLGVESRYIPNGWDPELGDPSEIFPKDRDQSDPFMLVHTGTLHMFFGRSPAPLFKALKIMRERVVDLDRRLRIVLAGSPEGQGLEMAADYGVADLFDYRGNLSRVESLGLQRQADALLLITSDRLSWELPGKLSEYMGAGRPVIALTGDSETAQVIRETGIGVSLEISSPRAIADGLGRVLEAGGVTEFNPGDLGEFRYPQPARRMEEALLAAIELRGSTPRR